MAQPTYAAYPQQYAYTPSSTMATPAPQQTTPSASDQNGSGAAEEEYYNLPGPASTSHIWDGRIWALEVVQHPQRARMCGFGDKDRRPISPPPCIRLIILDAQTRKEVKYEDIELAHLVLTVDIWDLGGTRELNLVKQSTASPCISSAATGAFPTMSLPRSHEPPASFPISQIPYQNYSAPAPTPTQAPAPTQSSYYPQGYYDDQQRYRQHAPNAYSQPPMYTPGFDGPITDNYAAQGTPTTQLYTRNLIGSLSASAFRLADDSGKLGIWFVLQDLSVRTEGWFRLKFSFFNLAHSVESQIRSMTNNGHGGDQSSGVINADQTAPCLGSAFSNPFKVFSAKKFPGVVESTELSKAFAGQGIKIPIRKDAQEKPTAGKRGREGSEDDEDNASDVDS